MNEDNKVVLKLEEYINLLDELKDTKIRLESKSVNYDVMCNNLKEEVKSSENYHIREILKENKINLNNTLNIKLKNYYYENIANYFIKVGITFDLVEKLTDEVIKECKEKEESESEE